MQPYRPVVRWLAAAATGGVLLQTGGCAGGLVPVFLSLAESVTLRILLDFLLL